MAYSCSLDLLALTSDGASPLLAVSLALLLRLAAMCLKAADAPQVAAATL